MKGIILAGGKGTRLYPATIPVCKPLIPVYDKPLIYYPLTSLMKAGIREVLIITPPGKISEFRFLLDDGSQWGMKFTYIEQKVQRGIADAFIIGEDFIAGENICLALGDNIFIGEEFDQKIKSEGILRNLRDNNATIFGLYVADPRPFGVVEIKDGKVLSIEEKPKKPKSNYIVPGIYFYGPDVCDIAKKIRPSKRGELEITSINNTYLENNRLSVITLEECEWYDAGTSDSLLDSAFAVKQRRAGFPEEEALKNHWITKDDIAKMAKKYANDYGDYLLKL